MNPGIGQYASSRLAFIVFIDSRRLDVDGTDLKVKVLAQDDNLNLSTPGILCLDPSAIIVWFLVVKYYLRVIIGICLYSLSDNGA
jgi:hypothetical protein